jgi:putative hemolysin
MMKPLIFFALILLVLTACTAPADQAQPTPVPAATEAPQANLPNPASVYCEAQGYRVEIRTASDGSQAGYCLFPDGSECDEWAYYRGECGPAGQQNLATAIPTAPPIDPTAYDQGWVSYTHPVYNFSLLLPEDWVAEQVESDALLAGHLLSLHPNGGAEHIRLAFRWVGEDVLLWPTGVGQGEFIQQGSLEIAGQAARRTLLVCPTGEITSIWYHGPDESQPNLALGDLEFAFIFSAGSHCEPGLTLGGKIQWVGEMILASLKAP